MRWRSQLSSRVCLSLSLSRSAALWTNWTNLLRLENQFLWSAAAAGKINKKFHFFVFREEEEEERRKRRRRHRALLWKRKNARTEEEGTEREREERANSHLGGEEKFLFFSGKRGGRRGWKKKKKKKKKRKKNKYCNMGSSEYLMKVQNLSNVETAGISQPQTLTQKLRYELQAQQVRRILSHF